jgi:tetratricopeptide (TPR) repeat protein
MGLYNDIFKKMGFPEKMRIGDQEHDVNPDALMFSHGGLEKYYKKDYLDSISDFSKAIKAQPDNPNFYIWRGTAYEDAENDIDAEKDFRYALKLDDTSILASYRLGLVYFRKKDFSNAIKWLKVAYANSTPIDLNSIGISDNNIHFIHKKIICSNLGNFLTQVKSYTVGFKYLDEAIFMDINYANPYMSKGLALIQMGNENEGMKYIEQAANLGDPKASETLQYLNNLLGRTPKKTDPSNPLNIIHDVELNLKHKMPDLVESFANDLMANYRIINRNNGSVKTDEFISLIIYYSIDLMIEYHNKALKTLPSSIIEGVKNQVLKAAQKNFDIFSQRDIIVKIFSEIDKKIWQANIIEETQNYMQQFQQ